MHAYCIVNVYMLLLLASALDHLLCFSPLLPTPFLIRTPMSIFCSCSLCFAPHLHLILYVHVCNSWGSFPFSSPPYSSALPTTQPCSVALRIPLQATLPSPMNYRQSPSPVTHSNSAPREQLWRLNWQKLRML